jgi:hypothetical protein
MYRAVLRVTRLTVPIKGRLLMLNGWVMGKLFCRSTTTSLLLAFISTTAECADNATAALLVEEYMMTACR